MKSFGAESGLLTSDSAAGIDFKKIQQERARHKDAFDEAKWYASDDYFDIEEFNLSFSQEFIDCLEEDEMARRIISKEDLATVISHIIALNNTPLAKADDIDHLGQRRVRFVGEILQQKVRTGMMQIKRNIQDRMSIIDVDTAMPIAIINQRPLQARIKEFFTTNQLSQFSQQQNILAEIEQDPP